MGCGPKDPLAIIADDFKILAEEAAVSEPVSARKTLLSGKIRRSEAVLRAAARENGAFSDAYMRNSLRKEQGILRQDQGSFRLLQGNFSEEQGDGFGLQPAPASGPNFASCAPRILTMSLSPVSSNSEDRMTLSIVEGRPVVARPTPLVRLARRLEQDPHCWLAAREIVQSLQASLAEPIPAALLAHLEERLEGTAQRQRGPNPRDRHVRDLLIWAKYYRMHRWLVARRKTRGLKGWRTIQGAQWWKGPPAERAARMTQGRLAPMLTWKQVQEIAQGVERERGVSRRSPRRPSVRTDSWNISRT